MISWKDYKKRQKTKMIGKSYIQYAEYGNDSMNTIVCIHGIPTWGYIFHDLAEKLSKNYHVLVPDLRGYGFSDKKDNFDRAIDKQANYLIQWMDEMGINKATIIGHDIGGGIAQRMATSYQKRLDKLCLMNCISYDSWPIELIIQLGHPATKKFSPKIVTGFLKIALKQGFEKSPPKELLEGMLAPWSTEEGLISLIRNASSLNTNHTTEITSLLSDISIPTLLIWGKNDKFQPIKFGKKLQADIPNSTLIEVENARHWVMLDRPELVYESLMEFLDYDYFHFGLKSQERSIAT